MHSLDTSSSMMRALASSTLKHRRPMTKEMVSSCTSNAFLQIPMKWPIEHRSLHGHCPSYNLLPDIIMSIVTLTLPSSSSDPAPLGVLTGEVRGSRQGVLTGEGSEEPSSMSAIFSDRGAEEWIARSPVRSGPRDGRMNLIQLNKTYDNLESTHAATPQGDQ